MLRTSALVPTLLLTLGCSNEPPRPVERPLLDVAAHVRLLRPADHPAGPVLAVCFETRYPLEPRPFPLDCSDFPPDFRPELRLTFLAGLSPVGRPISVPFRPDC
jgi:hypothetical protein